MSEQSKITQWTKTAKVFHWVIAVLILVQIPLGFYAVRQRNNFLLTLDLSRFEELVATFNWHKSIGLLIGAMMILRLGWRLTQGVPSRDALPPVLKLAAVAGHAALYLAVFASAASGYLINEAVNYQIDFLWLFEIPNLLTIDDAGQKVAELVHKILAWFLSGLVVLHIAASLYHHFGLKDDTLINMLPFGGGQKR